MKVETTWRAIMFLVLGTVLMGTAMAASANIGAYPMPVYASGIRACPEPVYASGIIACPDPVYAS